MSDEVRWVTVYFPSNLGFAKYEAKFVDFGEKRHAQHESMPYVNFVPKGKRKPVRHLGPFLLLDGLGHPDPPAAWVEDEPNGETSLRMSSGKYPMFDPRFDIEFNEVINPHSSRFLADYRSNKTTVLTEADKRWIKKVEAPNTSGRPSSVEETLKLASPFDDALLLDDRRRTMASVVQRLGQAEFRSRLMEIYNGRCAVTGFAVEGVLQAAHIVPYLGDHSNEMSNGLLLRADIHNLFDSFLLSIDPETMTVCLARGLKSSAYAGLHGRLLSCPESGCGETGEG